MEDNLSSADVRALLVFIEKAKLCNSQREFKELIESLKLLFKFDLWSATIGILHVSGNSISYYTINNLPKLWQIEYVMKTYEKIDPILMRNFNPDCLGEFQVWSETYEKIEQESDPTLLSKQRKFMSASHKYTGLQSGVSLGCFNSMNHDGLVFSVSSGDFRHTPRIVLILQTVIFYIDAAIKRVRQSSMKNILSDQQVKVLDLVQQGFTRAQIALQMDVSESTIKYHLDQAYHRLHAESQANAVAKALSRGLIKHI